MVENEKALGENLPERKKSSCMAQKRKKLCCEKALEEFRQKTKLNAKNKMPWDPKRTALENDC